MGLCAKYIKTRHIYGSIRCHNIAVQETSVIHVHFNDEPSAIREHLKRGYVLATREEPTIIAQGGFSKLTFVEAPIAAEILLEVEEAKAAEVGSKQTQGLSIKRLSQIFGSK